jgi:hypothetical protein
MLGIRRPESTPRATDAEPFGMNQNLGASFGLSVLTVLAFAVALYQPDKPHPSPSPPPAPALSRVEPEVVEAREPTATEPRPAAPRPAEAEPVPPPTPQVVSREPAAPVVTRPIERPARPVSRRQDAPVETEPRGPFTRARRGESLADVARRVYGSDTGILTLWSSNRDLIDREDAPLREGELLRTP